MKKIFLLIMISFLSLNSAYAEIEDNSIIDELDNSKIQELKVDFKLKTFKSCQDMEKVMGDYIKNYWESNKSKYNYRGGGIMYKGVSEPILMNDSVETSADSVVSESRTSSITKSGGGETNDFSKTNTQVAGVDESDIIKTDGAYIYYYNAIKKYVYIIDAKDPKNLKVIRKLKLPKYFYNPVLYIDNNKLVILSSGYSNRSFKGYYINKSNKTYAVIFDIKDKTKIKLDKIFISDGRLTKSRKIGNYLYIVSSNYFNIPYYSFKSADDIKITAKSILPSKLDISKVSDISKANLKIKGKKLPYRVSAGSMAKCSDIEYVLPDEETLKKFSFNPSYNIITTIDLGNTSKDAKTKVIAGSNSELYMSTKNMYLTESMYMPYNYRCPANARCIMPYYHGGTSNTLVHKLGINKSNINYKNSNIIPGRPLNQYSMDEKEGKFRIITSTNNWGANREQHTDLYILDENLERYSSLTKLGKGESFKSSRFLGDKLFLVTFKQIDPLFVIDLKNQKKPKVIGELKMPGYSTYLHPYDENHLIGLGYDTYENKWGGTQNGGLKVDLYEINYDKKDLKNKDYIEVKQLHSYTLGDSGSYSEALNNPRMFMWNDNKKLLLLPATIYKNESKSSYKHIDFFQGLYGLNIDKEKGISEKYKISHIDTSGMDAERKKECEKYIKPKEETKCRKLWNGEEYCPPKTKSYVPEYCFADSSLGSYIASRSWKFRNQFVKRALWIENNIFTISDKEITTNDIYTGKQKDFVEMK